MCIFIDLKRLEKETIERLVCNSWALNCNKKKKNSNNIYDDVKEKRRENVWQNIEYQSYSDIN
jgi:hypothetical protein